MSFSVTEVVTAVRCPRQLVLAREGRRVIPLGGAAIGVAAHAALAAVASGAAGDVGLLRALAAPRSEANDEKAAHACYRLAHAEAFQRARKLASTVDGADLSRLDGVVRSLARLVATLLLRAAVHAKSPAEAIATALLASEKDVELDLGDEKVRGRIDLCCHDVATGETWLWDLKTYAGTDAAQQAQVRLYALAWRKQDRPAQPALLHVTDERVEIARSRPLAEESEIRLGALLHLMKRWADGVRVPPAAADRNTCRTCPAQDACWSRWGRTLPDEDSTSVREPRRPSGPPASGRPSVDGRVTAPFPLRRRPGASDAGTGRETIVGVGPAAPQKLSSRPSGSGVAPAPLWIGKLESGTEARLEPTDLLRHVAVFGASGAGKTYLAKSIVEEALLAGVPALVFDVQGDLAQLASPRAELPAELAARRDAYAARIEARIFTPASDAGLRISLNPLHLPDRTLGEDERSFCLASMAENLLGPLKIPASWRNVAKDYVVQHLEAALLRGAELGLEELVDRVRDASQLDTHPLANAKQREKLHEQMRLLTVGTQRLLFQRGRPLDVGALLQPTVPGTIPLNVLWLNALGDQAAKERFVGMVLTDVYAWMLRHPAPRPQLLLYLNEVGPFMPPSREPATKAILKRLFKEGRKYGVCGLFCTQDFTDVDYKVFAQANTVALGRVGSSQNKDRAKKILQDVSRFDAKGAVDKLASAPSGRFLVKSSDRYPAPVWLQGRELLTEHGSPWGEEEIRAQTPASLRKAWEQV